MFLSVRLLVLACGLLLVVGCRSSRRPVTDPREGATVILLDLLRPLPPTPLHLAKPVLAAQGFTVESMSPNLAARQLLTTPRPLPPPAQGTFQVRITASDEQLFLQAHFLEQTPTGEQKGYARWHEATNRTPKAVFQVLEQLAAAVPHKTLKYIPIPFEQHARQAAELRQAEEWKRAQGKDR
ncbi:hypothetical protein [Hymenobacter sp. HDW8]|uniref:hypothetical protein n=1 Tax=Hymenobacter sp. HDW8 TaxID=2714932 RepID=UPI00140817F3|nr:hypothetical protein [Hymenobacter sp. HDW8]QIL78454.1 hypothetical protein G7064_21780 [Hymenobacter sp. HDW8]